VNENRHRLKVKWINLFEYRGVKVEVEKGFVRTVFGHELVDPETKINLEN